MKKEEILLSEHELDRVGKALRPYLDASAQNIKPGVAYRLAEARRAAIASLDAQAASSTGVSGGTLALAGGWRTRVNDWRFWATGLFVAGAIAVYGYQQWSDNQAARDAADVDVMLLADDVPVDALLDKGFSHFLKEDQ
ncbi:MAG: DUF3619 family protein [Burkholderiales bacterium]|nr:DUF3619 family protein [Burkholderiales bacterium]